MSTPPPANLPGPEADQPPEMRLDQVVELAELVAHEVNNLLNNILLHVAVLDRKGLETVRAELALIRQASVQAGAMINRWQQLAPRRPAELQAVDLNKVVAEVLASIPAPAGGSPAMRFEPAAGLPAVLGHPLDLERLVRLLVVLAAAAADKGFVTVRTLVTPMEVLLYVEDSGPALDPGVQDRLFEPFFTARHSEEGESDLQSEIGLALCKRLARRQQGSIHAENRTEGGVRVVVHFRPATNP